MTSRIKDMLGVQFPIFQAPMGSVTNTKLIAAVANAGCVGMHAVSWDTPDEIDTLFAATRAASDGVFGANLVLEWDQQERLDTLIANECKLVSFFWGDPAPYLDKAKANGMITMLTVGTAAEARHAADIGVDIVVAQGWEAGGHVWSNV
ncbi:MAG: NAD(P)H-dependent flavin oxidoreductase, partial [Woeseiales bacterium]